MLLDRTNTQINSTQGQTSTYTRVYNYPDLAPVIGYNHPLYGQSGLEASLDEYLRGLRGNPSASIWWNHLLYGMAPKGLDVRLSLDLYLQYRADEMMKGQRGAVILLNAQTGEIYVMASHPTFDPSRLDEIGTQLNKDPDKPLINRATQGLYPIGTMSEPFEQALRGKQAFTAAELQAVYKTFGFKHAPQLRMQVAQPTVDPKGNELHVSPLQVALAATALSNHGTIPAPRITMAVNTPNSGWVSLPALGTSFEVLPPTAADETAQGLKVEDQNFWAHTGHAESDKSLVTWFMAGTLPNWQATPLVVVVLLEEDDARSAQHIGRELLIDAMNP
jgi:cell division protein FtsI/penicillin-binding protein 2